MGAKLSRLRHADIDEPTKVAIPIFADTIARCIPACPVCLKTYGFDDTLEDTVFACSLQCGHDVCHKCACDIPHCPVCEDAINTPPLISVNMRAMIETLHKTIPDDLPAEFVFTTARDLSMCAKNNELERKLAAERAKTRTVARMLDRVEFQRHELSMQLRSVNCAHDNEIITLRAAHEEMQAMVRMMGWREEMDSRAMSYHTNSAAAGKQEVHDGMIDD